MAAPAATAATPATSSKGSLREDLTCAICCDLFREPVMLACMHHFCKPCISRYWRGTQGPVSCPQCRKEFSSKQFQTNYLVAAMVEKIRASMSDTHIKNLEVSSCLLEPGSCWRLSILKLWSSGAGGRGIMRVSNLMQTTFGSKVNRPILTELSALFELHKF